MVKAYPGFFARHLLSPVRARWEEARRLETEALADFAVLRELPSAARGFIEASVRLCASAKALKDFRLCLSLYLFAGFAAVALALGAVGGRGGLKREMHLRGILYFANRRKHEVMALEKPLRGGFSPHSAPSLG